MAKTKHFLASPSITTEFRITYDEGKYQVQEYNLKTLAKADKKTAKGKKCKFKVTSLLAYFRVTNPQGDVNIFDFNPPLEIKIKYSPEAWDQAVENNEKPRLDYPRVAYLSKKEDWAGEWVEFDVSQNDVTYPGTNGNPYGYLEFEIDKLPDPLIGGC